MSTVDLKNFGPSTRYRFQGVVVDPGSSRLFVDGRERNCSQRAFRLLQIMCESEGRLLPKQEVIDLLWPGGQVISDEALTQAVFRARACIGRYSESLVTVRGVGLRLDAEIDNNADHSLGAMQAKDSAANDVDLDTGPASSAITGVVKDPRHRVTHAEESNSRASKPSRIPRSSVRTWSIIFAALLLVIVGIYEFRGPSPAGSDVAVLDIGYGLFESDALTSRADTIPLIRDAFKHEGLGDRARGCALLETAHDTDPKTPIPAMFLGLWSIGGGDAATADRWLTQAHARLQGVNSPVLTALLGYIEAERSESLQDVLRYAGAVIDLRPEAWQLRLARAHLLMSDGLRDAALSELRAIKIDSFAHRKLAMALADRASLGDVNGAEAELARIEPRLAKDATLAYTRGRFAWTRGDFNAASIEFARTVEAGKVEARFDLVNRAKINLGIIAMLAGETDRAIRDLETARIGMRDSHWLNDEIDISLILAQLHAINGDLEGAEADLSAAENVANTSGLETSRDLCRVVRARLFGLDLTNSPESTVEPALQPLLDAHAALRRGDTQAAQIAYRLANRRISTASPLHDEVRWLATRLGEPVADAVPIDPPYPPMLRFATRMAMRQLEALKLENPAGAAH